MHVTHSHFVSSLYVEDQVLDKCHFVQVRDDTKTCAIMQQDNSVTLWNPPQDLHRRLPNSLLSQNHSHT